VKLLSNAMYENNLVYRKQLADLFESELNLSISIESTFFNGMQNDTVHETPMGTTFANESEVLVNVHNPSAKLLESHV